ncbi:hypothetical protein GCM10022276_01730 [Sphingomonas limnosediminicola]|uniref:DUF1488 family protein n=1 Tax=Sphingomonas limnosediminicola TaxID=940133 RepID=A0ABP7KRS0_9SPHN
MENDSIRSSGADTLVEIWIEGKLRSVCISQQAIGAYVGFEKASGMSDRDRSEFVRAHLPLIVSAAKAKLLESNLAADNVVIDVDDLPRDDGAKGNRRKAERRKTDRRRSNQPRGALPDRRRSDRRQGERRSPPPKQD